MLVHLNAATAVRSPRRMTRQCDGALSVMTPHLSEFSVQGRLAQTPASKQT